jgi:predicted metal-binding protein
MVCTKCTRRTSPETCNGAGACRLANNVVMGDMEDLMSGPGGRMNPSLQSSADVDASSKNITMKTGRKLYHRLRARYLDAKEKEATKQHTRRKSTINVNHPIEIIPVSCLSNCDRGNCIAVTASGKFTYQFGDLDERKPEVLDDIMRFVSQYTESEDGFSKTKTRPTWMKSNVLARIPPLPLPQKVQPDWYDREAEQRLEYEELKRRTQTSPSSSSSSSSSSGERCECKRDFIR